jgi:hypothetical protein
MDWNRHLYYVYGEVLPKQQVDDFEPIVEFNRSNFAVVLHQFYNLGVESICLSLWFIVGNAGAIAGEVAIGTDGAAH